MKTLATLIELTKPRALVMIVFTTGISYLIAATEAVQWLHLLHTLIGCTVAAGGSLAVNQYMERELDARMTRTATRPIPSGRVSAKTAAWFGYVTMIGGYIYLWFLVNPACSIATMICGVSYNYMYTPMKRTTSFSSFVGAIPGGMLPIMGWVAARNQMELGAWILFTILFLWQIPHALIISMRHHKDYAAVNMKQLPLVSTPSASRKQIILNILVLVPVSLLPVLGNMTELTYPIIALTLGFLLFVVMLRFVMTNTTASAKVAFISLSAYLPLLLLAMYFDKPGA